MKTATGAVLLNMGAFLLMGALAVVTMAPEPLIAAALACTVCDVAVLAVLPGLQGPAGGAASRGRGRAPRCRMEEP